MDQAKDSSVKSTVNGEHTAIMVIHGIGEQVPFETLDMFTRGMLDSLNARAKSKETSNLQTDTQAENLYDSGNY